MTPRMDPDDCTKHIERPESLNGHGSGGERLELISVIWEAVESLISPDLEQRMNGLQRLVEYDAIRQLPLAAYVLTSRITEPDIEFRNQIVKNLGSLAGLIGSGAGAIQSVEDTLIYQLSQMRMRRIFALLQVSVYDKTSEGYVANLLSYCSYAGTHLAQILSDRSAPADVRKQAAHYIGEIGYLDALPVLERMASRIESRGNDDDARMLPALQYAVQLLTAP